jgi:hypothetical protein
MLQIQLIRNLLSLSIFGNARFTGYPCLAKSTPEDLGITLLPDFLAIDEAEVFIMSLVRDSSPWTPFYTLSTGT